MKKKAASSKDRTRSPKTAGTKTDNALDCAHLKFIVRCSTKISYKNNAEKIGKTLF